MSGDLAYIIGILIFFVGLSFVFSSHLYLKKSTQPKSAWGIFPFLKPKEYFEKGGFVRCFMGGLLMLLGLILARWLDRWF